MSPRILKVILLEIEKRPSSAGLQQCPSCIPASRCAMDTRYALDEAASQGTP